MGSSPLEPIARRDWDVGKARHLLNRAGFGVPRTRIAQLADMSPEDAVDSLVNFQPPPVSTPSFIIQPLNLDDLRDDMMNESTPEQRRSKVRDRLVTEREAINRLKVWWLERMMTTPAPLQEKLALFWHGHFATSANKVRSSWHNYSINALFREQGAGNVKSLTLGVAQSPAMLHYLDNARSRKGRPNENWARELLELFTLGKGHYTEQDIREAARAFTGWSTDGAQFLFRPGMHDTGTKTFLGRTGALTGYDILEIIFAQPAAAEHLCTKLWTFFVEENPNPEAIRGLAETLRTSGYEMRPVLRQVFLSRAFYSDTAMGRQIQSPVQFVIKVCHDLHIEPPPYVVMTRSATVLGQELLNPPSVKGWDGNRAWINAHTLLGRYNVPPVLVKVLQRDRPEGVRRKDTWSPRPVFQGLRFSNVGECVDALAGRLLPVPITAEQRRVLAEALCPGLSIDAPVRLQDLRDDGMRAALHLVTSMAEYQLC